MVTNLFTKDSKKKVILTVNDKNAAYGISRRNPEILKVIIGDYNFNRLAGVVW